MNTKPIIVFSILILLSGTTLANESMNRNSKFDSYLRECNDSYFSPYAEIIPRLLIIEKESFTIQLVRLPEENFFGTVRAKVVWGIDKRN